MAATNAAFTTGAEQNVDVRRRNVPGAEKSKGNVASPAIHDDKKNGTRKVR